VTNKSPSPKRPGWILIGVQILLVVALYFAFKSSRTAPGPKQVSYSSFLEQIRAGQLQEVLITDKALIGTRKPEKKGAAAPQISTPRLPGIDEKELLNELEQHHVQFTGRPGGNSWILEMLIWVVPLLLLFAIFGFGARRMSQSMGGALTVGKSRAKIYDQSTKLQITFKDVAGVDEAKGELVEVVDFLQNPGKYQKLGGRIPKGVLLVGAPGTGKTLLARAVAGEAGVSFFSISGSEFVEMFVGVGAARVRDLFEQAKTRAPCIIFIDELDAIGKSRAAGRGPLMANEEREQTLNQLLVEMDGFDTSQGIIIMAATNTPEVLDAALLRPGRFDRQVVLDRPDVQGRVEILQVHARKVKVAPEVDWRTIAARTPGMVGADLANVVNEAALLAARRGGVQVVMADLEEAVNRVMLGLEKRRRVMTQEEKERVAYHETGHALVALSVEHADPVHRISIIPRSIGALGYTLQLPLHERFLMTQPEMEDQLAVMLGGRAAEEVVYKGVVSTGGADDLERASELVRQMVTRFGMNKELGLLTYGHPMAGKFLRPAFGLEERNYSERSATIIDNESRRVLAETYERVKDLLQKRRADLEHVTRRLIEKETLERAEVDSLLSQAAEMTPGRLSRGTPFPPPSEGPDAGSKAQPIEELSTKS
jgi:cell division protease FtsH